MEEKIIKSRYWASIVYVDALEKFIETHYPAVAEMNIGIQEKLSLILRRSYQDYAISPVHSPDEDVDSDHLHLVYRHPSPVRLDVVRDCNKQFPFIHNGFFLALHHPRNYQRYLLHLDNPEKEQFKGESIAVVNNFPLDLSRDLSSTEQIEIQMQIEDFAVEFDIFEYASMTRYLSGENLIDHYKYFTTHTHHFGKFLDSLRHSKNDRKESDINL